MNSERALAWYVKRLRVMPPGEILSRIGSQCGLAVLSLQHRLGLCSADKPQMEFRRFRFCTSAEPELPVLPYRGSVSDAMCARVLAGELAEPGWNWSWRPDPHVWHLAPDTGRTWPRQFFGSIPYREGNPSGDVRCVWEPSRLQQLVVLGLIAKEGDQRMRNLAVDTMETQFLSWMDANPFLTGVHYISAMECGLRLIAVCHAFDIVRTWLHSPDRVWPALLQLVERHADLIWRRVSLHSSLGNHTVAEAAALLYAGFLFPEMPRAPRWRMAGLTLLESESSHQVSADGGGVEQGIWYLRFISDLYGLAIALLSARGRQIPEGIQRAFERSRTFLSALADESGRLPSIGDGDNGYALCPLLECSSAAQRRKPGLTTFDVSGYSLLDTKETCPTRLILDHGPLGMAPCFAHGHADALSIVFRAGAHDVFIDPGTFSYTGHPAWRRYFRGTRAHNTVVVDGLDQAVQETAFLWSSPYRARLVYRDEQPGGGVILIAAHEGFAERIGVMHWRGLHYQPPGMWIVLDVLIGSGTHDFELNWHLGVEPALESGVFCFPAVGTGLCLSLRGGMPALLTGDAASPAGWRSTRYGFREPAYTLRVRHRGDAPHEFSTSWWFGRPDDDRRTGDGSLERLRQLIHESRTH